LTRQCCQHIAPDPWWARLDSCQCLPSRWILQHSPPICTENASSLPSAEPTAARCHPSGICFSVTATLYTLWNQVRRLETLCRLRSHAREPRFHWRRRGVSGRNVYKKVHAAVGKPTVLRASSTRAMISTLPEPGFSKSAFSSRVTAPNIQILPFLLYINRSRLLPLTYNNPTSANLSRCSFTEQVLPPLLLRALLVTYNSGDEDLSTSSGLQGTRWRATPANTTAIICTIMNTARP
jgi:hypothetical protein